MRWLWILAAVLCAGCAPAPPPADRPKPDVTAEAWYAPTVEQLSRMAREAASAVRRGNGDEAGKIITDAQPLVNKVLAAPRPTLAAMEAASDLDELYGRMLMGNGRYGWARMLFQKNEVRWRTWRPQTEESRMRLATAASEIAECDRRIAGQP